MRYLYSNDHVWVRPDPAGATLGISPHAAAELGEITFVELPRLGTRLVPGAVLCVVESVKTAADVLCPVCGVVAAINQCLVEQPGLVNRSPAGAGWICQLAAVDDAALAGLLSEADYATFVASAQER